VFILASRPATRLGPHLWLAAACIVVVIAVIALTFVLTGRRIRRSAMALPDLPAPPRPFPIPLITPMPGVALGTTVPRGWQDAGIGGVLGNRTSGDLSVTCVGVDVAGLWLPRAALRSAEITDRFATKFMPGPGLIVVGWEVDSIHYESGFRGAASRYEEVVATVRGLLADAQSETPPIDLSSAPTGRASSAAANVARAEGGA
jgi:hypothetical protein